MKIIKLAAVSALALVAAPVMAQEVGTTILGNDDEPIGTVTANDGTTVTLDTGTHVGVIGATSFGKVGDAWKLGATKAQVDGAFAAQKAKAEAEAAAAAEARAAALAAALVEGATVVSMDEMPLGAIKIIQADAIVLIQDEDSMTLPRNLFAVNDAGLLIVQAKHADIVAAMAAQSEADAG